MDLVSFNLPAMLRRTNMKLLLMLLCVIICLIIIFMSSRLAYRPPVHTYGRYDDPSKYERGIVDRYDNNMDNRDDPELDDRNEDSVVFNAGGAVAGSRMDDTVTNVAIGVAVTAHDDPTLTLENVGYRLPFLRTLIPSFCRTASPRVVYRFYVAFDVHDPMLSSQQYMIAVNRRFEEVVAELCVKATNVSLHFVQCNHNRNPAWAQNDAMMEAYLDHMQYYYRVNDDTEMLSPGWTEVYISALQNNFSPPNVGVVGPLHKGGNEFILTYDFVHRTHIDIFGYYYPRGFTDWWADTWISCVYEDQRTLKLPGVRLVHTLEAGQRYAVKSNKQKYLEEQLEEDRITLRRYLKSVEDAKKASKTPPGEPQKKVISMSLWGSKPRYTYGALRNAQLVPVHFPGWTLRFYVERPRYDDTTVYAPSPPRILSKLATLGVEIVYVDAERSHIPPMMWRFLVADDMSVDVFVVRDSDCRLTDRDFAVVSAWLRTDFPFHCVRDHPSHAGYSVLGGLWGGHPRPLRTFLPVPWRDMMMGYRTEYIQDMQFLANAVWPAVETHAAYCHDSVSCLDWARSHPFPVPRVGTEHLGQVFDAFGNARDEDLQILLEHRPLPQCSVMPSPTPREDPRRDDSVTAENENRQYYDNAVDVAMESAGKTDAPEDLGNTAETVNSPGKLQAASQSGDGEKAVRVQGSKDLELPFDVVQQRAADFHSVRSSSSQHHRLDSDHIMRINSTDVVDHET